MKILQETIGPTPTLWCLQIHERTHQPVILDKDKVSEDPLKKPPADKHVYLEEGGGPPCPMIHLPKMSQGKKRGI